MDQSDRERGRTSRASSTSSLGREVRCACQFFQSDSLLPERRAMIISRPSSRNAAQPPNPNIRTSEDDANSPGYSGEHEYEPIGTPLVQVRTMTPVPSAPVVRIIDTDVVPVADSDDSIDLRGRFTPGLEGNDLILPLDGKIEDSTMEAREIAGSGDTSEELESPQQVQDRIEERFFNATPRTESRTDGEVNTSQVDSVALEELPLHRGARGLPQRLRSQAGKLRSRIKGIQRPNFSIPIDRLRSNMRTRGTSSERPAKDSSEKSRTSSEKTRTSSEKTKSSSDKKSSTSDRTLRGSGSENKDPRSAEKRTKMERLRSSLPDRPKINFPDRPKFNFPDRSKFHLPDRSKFHLPDRSKFHLPERPKFNIKKPNIRFPTIGKSRSRAPSLGDVPRQRSSESTSGSRKNIFDFSTYPRIFDKKSKTRGEYATSSPNESRAQSTESSTLPRAKKTAPLGPRWAQRFTDIKFADEDEESPKTLAERSKPWRRPSLEEPRLSLRVQDSIEEPESLPWEDSDDRKRVKPQIEELPSEEEEPEEDFDRPRGLKLIRRGSEDSYDEEPPRIDPRLYGDQDVRLDEREIEIEELEDEESMNTAEREAYRASFMPVDPRIYKQRRISSEDLDEHDVEDEPLSMEEDISARSDREQQQSSGSSCDRRRRGVIEEIDSDEFFLREKGISQDDMNVGRYLTSEIRDALRTPTNALAHEVIVLAPQPPQRPARTRSMRKRKEPSVESYDVVACPPARPKRENQRRSIDYDYDEDISGILGDNGDDSISSSRHRVVYHAESAPLDLGRMEPLDDIVVVKPLRRKSKSSLRSQSLRRSESLAPQPEEVEQLPVVTEPAPPPRRRKRLRGEESRERAATPMVNGLSSCNGHHSPVSMEVEERIRTPAPKKPERAASRETLRSLASRLEHEDVDSPPPVPPKRLSRSRGTSVVADDDRTSHGGESIPDMGYGDEDFPQEDNDSRLDYPGYAVIEKREKPPRPPPPRRRRDDKFATTPRSGSTPNRPQRGYSTLKPVRSITPSEVTSDTLQGILDTTPYEELDSEEDEHRNYRSGVVVSKIQGRPLPAPPRPARSRRERNADNVKDAPEMTAVDVAAIATEAFASTQTDPLPDDMVIEEEVTQAKLIVSPSRSGSQILVSTERIPSPTCSMLSGAARTSSQGVVTMERPSSPVMLYETEFISEPPERSVSQVLERIEKSPTPVRRSTMPAVPPLPTQQSLYHDDLEFGRVERDKSRSTSPFLTRERRSHREEEFGRVERDKSRSTSPFLTRERRSHRDEEYERNDEERIQSINERIRLEEEIEHARRLHAALLSNEPLKISSLEVGDLRVDRLSVSNLEAHKITASEIDALVVSATEISNTGETTETAVDLQPTLLRELIAIRSQLELANSLQEAPREYQADNTMARKTRDAGGTKEIDWTTTAHQPTLLQLDQVSRNMETRALFSSVGSSRESSPQPTLPSILPPARSKKSEDSKKENESIKEETRQHEKSKSRSRSPSPGRISPGGLLRQTTSPVKSLPPVISVTPDSPDVVHTRIESSEVSRPQRAVISFAQESEGCPTESVRESSQSPSPRPASPSVPPTATNAQYIAFSTSQIPPQFFALASPSAPAPQPVQEAGIADLGQQLFHALRVASKRALRHFVGYVVTRVGHEETDTKIREIELALCALLLIIAGLLIVCFAGPRTITHHHHWDYFNPPRL